MAKIKNPILFSQYFNVKPEVLDKAGLIDPFLNVDTQLFIDPVLLAKSNFPQISQDGLEAFKKHFSNFIRLLSISQNEGDAAWKGAQKLLNLREPPENGLGYGGSSRSGSSRPDSIRDSMMRTSKEIIELGSNDPEMISLMGFFEEDVGADTISDFTTRVIINQLADITKEFCETNGISVSEVNSNKEIMLPRFQKDNGSYSSIVLIPKDIVRDLPIANDWSGIQAAAMENFAIREKVNGFLGAIAKPTVADRKAALRNVALSSAISFEEFLSIVKENVNFYDSNEDALGYYELRKVLSQNKDILKTDKVYDIEKSPEELVNFVKETINNFKHHVENGNLWEELWLDGKPKKERAAQLIYFAMADCFCSANDIDISPEAHMGGGPIDFKFSKGYHARVLVEMKRSNGSVVHGYEKQLEIYKKAAKTEFGIYVVMDYGDLDKKLDKIQMIQRSHVADGKRASEIIVIDATQKKSASKRKELKENHNFEFAEN